MGQHIDQLMQRYSMASTPKLAKGGYLDYADVSPDEIQGYEDAIAKGREYVPPSFNLENEALYQSGRDFDEFRKSVLKRRGEIPDSAPAYEKPDISNLAKNYSIPEFYSNPTPDYPEAAAAPEAVEPDRTIVPSTYFEDMKALYGVNPNVEQQKPAYIIPEAKPDLSRLAENYQIPAYDENPTVYKSENPVVDTANNPFNAPSETATAPTVAAAEPRLTEVATAEPKLENMLAKYQAGESVYGPELRLAREEAKRESDAFQQMLQKAISSPAENAPSKAEMYFRLAAAFGSPSKTGHFSENLAKAGEAMAEYKKSEREAKSAARAQNLQLGIKGQELRMQGAKENLASLRSLAGEEMKDKRAIATEMMKEYIKSGQPQSTAGKQALDEGLVQGTPEFQKRVAAIAELNIDKQMANINAALGNLSVAQANSALQNQKFNFQKEQAGKLTSAEVKMKSETEDNLASTDQAMKNLQRAYQLNPNTFDSSLADVAQRKVLEAAGSKDPKVIATREQENLLTKQVLTQLKGAFGAAPSDAEQRIMKSVQGIEAKSKEERALILKDAYKALKTKRDQQQKRLNEISQGLYRETTPAPGGIE